MTALRSLGRLFVRSFGTAIALALCAMNAGAQTPPAARPAPSPATGTPDPTGDWRTTVMVGASKLRLAMHLGPRSTFDSPDQGVNGLPAFTSVADGKVTVLIPGKGQFVGTLAADGRTLNGTLSQGTASVDLSFERGLFMIAHRPQTPRPPFPYKTEDVAYDNPRQAGVRLSGTLTIPQGKGPFPAVLLITGSGTQDRDETLFEHKPFLLLADALTRRGIAVLRVDDRGIGGSGGGLPDPTSADFASDVERGVAWLRARPEIDPRRVGLLGHSEGGLIAPMVAAKDPNVAFILLWAAPGINGKEVVIDQARLAVLAGSGSAETAQRGASLQRTILDALLAAPDSDAARRKINALMASAGAPPVADRSIALMSTRWYRYFMALEPAVALKAVKVPVLALLGGKDQQVSPQANEAALRAALAENKQARVEVLPGLNHLFQKAPTGALTEYGDIEQTMDPKALKRMVNWVAEVTKAKR